MASLQPDFPDYTNHGVAKSGLQKEEPSGQQTVITSDEREGNGLATPENTIHEPLDEQPDAVTRHKTLQQRYQRTDRFSWEVSDDDQAEMDDIIRSLLRPAEAGSAPVQLYLGRVYRHGKGVAVDYTTAENWIHKAADQGCDYAQAEIGAFYSSQHPYMGVEKEDSTAVMWFRKAADQENPLGQFLLAIQLENGSGVPKDLPMALELYRKATDQGMAEAQYKLGVLLLRGGEGVEQNLVEGLRYIRLAHEGGVKLGYAQVNDGKEFDGLDALAAAAPEKKELEDLGFIFNVLE